jgi:hypothetical protein
MPMDRLLEVVEAITMETRETAKFMTEFGLGEGHQRGGGALAKVKDGYGGARPKRSYWKWKRKTMVPDGLVQKRILQFTGIVGQNSGGGGISVFGGQPGSGKRKWDGL